MFVAVAGFGAGFVLSKVGAINQENSSRFATVVSVIVAAGVALAADGPSGAVAILGRFAIFGIVWFFFWTAFHLRVIAWR